MDFISRISLGEWVFILFVVGLAVLYWLLEARENARARRGIRNNGAPASGKLANFVDLLLQDPGKLFAGVFLIALIGGICFLWMDLSNREAAVKDGDKLFRVTAAKYPTPDELRGPNGWELSNFKGGYIKGKAVVLDVANRRYVELNLDLPEEIRAESPGEVETVVWVGAETSRTGTYEGGGAAMETRCAVYIVDLSIPAVVGNNGPFVSTPPDYVKVYDGGTTKGKSYGGGWPNDAMARYLSGLERR